MLHRRREDQRWRPVRQHARRSTLIVSGIVSVMGSRANGDKRQRDARVAAGGSMISTPGFRTRASRRPDHVGADAAFHE